MVTSDNRIVYETTGRGALVLKKIPLWSIGPRQRYYYLVILVLEFEEVLGIVVADVFDHLIYAIHFRYRNFSVLHITSYQIT